MASLMDVSKPTLTFNYRPMQTTEQDLERFATCFRENGSSKNLEELRWQYLDNPVGRTFVDFALDSSGEPPTIAGIYAVQPVRMRVGNACILGAQSVNTLTDHRYRGQGLFVSLARSVYHRCAEQGVGLVYGFPNGQSAHGFFTKLDWQPLDPVPFLVRPLQTRYVAEQLSKLGNKVPSWLKPLASLTRQIPNVRLPLGVVARGVRLQTIDHFDERFDELWRSILSAGRVAIAVDREHQYLQWRFVRKPRADYQRLAIYQKEQLLGFVVFTVLRKHQGCIGYVMELLYKPGHHTLGATLLSAALQRMLEQGADVALAWNMPHSPNRLAYLQHLFIPLPSSLRPIELHMGVRTLQPLVSAEPSQRESWYISYSDSDTV